jgi:hypothetical protein
VGTITNFSSYRVLIAQRPCNPVALCRDLRYRSLVSIGFLHFLGPGRDGLPTLDIWSNRKEDQSLILFAKVKMLAVS